MGIPELTAIEEEVVLLVAAGHSPRTVAAELGLSVSTVEWHAARARRKLEHAATLRDRVRDAERPGQQGGSA